MKVLYLAEHYPPMRGGTVTYVVNLFDQAKRLGLDARLVTFAPPDHVLAPSAPGVSLVALPSSLIRGDGTYARITSKLLPFLMKRAFDAAYREFRPDLIHIANGYYINLLTRSVPSCPVVWTVNNVPPQEHGLHLLSGRAGDLLNSAYRAFITQQTRVLFHFYRWTRIIVPSEPTAALLRRHHVPDGEIVLVPHGVDATAFPPVPPAALDRDFPTLVCVAGIAATKGLDVLARALADVLPRHPSLRVEVIGEVRDEAYFNQLKTEIDRLGQTSHWRFAGRVADVAERIARAHLYVQPSREEGFCLAVLEALACHRFVVASAVGDIPNMVTHGTGVLVPPDEPRPLTAAILDSLGRICASPPSAESFGEATQPYTWPEITRRTIDVYHQVA